MVQETYSLSSLDEDVDEDRIAGAQYAPFENMLSATHLVASVLVAQQGQSADRDHAQVYNALGANICYAIQGGFSMQLRGGRKSTRDVDLITSIKMKGVCIVIPDSRLVEGVLKVFVKTGRPWDECTEQHRIELDIKQAGFRISPRKLEGNFDRVGPFNVFGESVEFNVLGIDSMMRIRVECCLTREEQRDFDDVKFMLRQYPEEVYRAIDEGIVDPKELSEALGHDKMGNERVRNELMKMVDKYVT